MKHVFKYTLVSFCVLVFTQALAQDNKTIIQEFFNQEKSANGWSESDINNWIITNEYHSKSTNVDHVYIKQTVNGIEICDGLANFNVRDGKVFSYGSRLITNVAQKANASSPGYNPVQAIKKAAEQLGLSTYEQPSLLTSISKHEFVYDKAGVSLENIPVKLVYQSVNDEALRLAWDLSINTLDAQNWWSVRVDAFTGEIISKNNWTNKCVFDKCTHSTAQHAEPRRFHFLEEEIASPPPVAGSYNVFAIPVESPSHGPRSIVTDPENLIASPFGWHDDDGVPGSEYTDTRGNNVHAYEDISDINQPGDYAEGGAGLNFDFSFNPNIAPVNNLDASITNLFYMNNIMHDVWYQYGFDEASGNFQETHYTNSGGNDGDYVRAEAQDGSGEDNANFSTPNDGQNPRMQMYRWTPSVGNFLSVHNPEALDIEYLTTTAVFGPPIPTSPLTAELVLVDDEVGPDPHDACEIIENEDDIIDRIAVINRGTCLFVDKVQDAQDLDAVGVIIINNVPGGPISMGAAAGSGTGIDIPSVMISQEQGAALIAALQNGETIEGTLHDANGGIVQTDSDFDNGIIAHEYGHGISIRLTGGGNNSNCLGNDEQMGEGWSDWFGIMLTMNEDDVAEMPRGVGTYVTGESIDGTGIRPAPYSTDFSLNNFTYAATNNDDLTSMPHGIGFVWSTMLWDLNWALIDEYGFDPDVYNGTGGNNIAMQLVIDGLKLQPCSPGFVDGRDAILEADMLNYGGANQCLIWQVFANRGLGASASQGSSNSRFDQSEAFDVPTIIGEYDFTFCEGSSITINGNTYDTEGDFEENFQTAGGCDSTAVYHITTGSPNTIINQNVNVLTADNEGAGVTYQWIDCSNNSDIPGATNQEFNPTASGEYAVMITEENCSGMSECFEFTFVGIQDNFADEISISPNPATDQVQVSFGELSGRKSLKITDTRGRVALLSDNIIDNNVIIDIANYSNGIYFFEIFNDYGSSVFKVVKR